MQGDCESWGCTRCTGCKNYSHILSNHFFLFTHNEDNKEIKKICHLTKHQRFIGWSTKKKLLSSISERQTWQQGSTHVWPPGFITASHRIQEWKTHIVKKLPLLQKAAARLLSNTSYYEHIVLARWSPHKLPHDFRVQVKVIATVLKTLCGTGLRHLRDCHPLCSYDLLWQLCSLGTMKLSAEGRGSAMQKTQLSRS